MKPELEDERYFVEYLDHAQGIAAIKQGGGDIECDTMWDYCDQNEITVRKQFPSKWRAVEWARRHNKADVFHMPRIVEETYQERSADQRQGWEQTGYWEMDGRTEINE